MKKEFRNFEDARTYVRKLNFKNQGEWFAFCKTEKKPQDIPTSANRHYKNKGWIGWGDFLGTGSIANTVSSKKFLSLEDARSIVNSLNFTSASDWRRFCKSDNKPKNIPSNPQQVYEKWISWGDWLGTGKVSDNTREYRKLEDARKFVHSLGLNGQKEWREYAKSGKKPDDIPADPRQTFFKKGWINYGDWLGTGNLGTKKISENYLTFKEAREEVRKLAKKYNIKKWDDWKDAVKKGRIPKNIPQSPEKVYAKNRVEKKTIRKFRDFKSARKFVRNLGLDSETEWKEYCKLGKKPEDIPTAPKNSYKKDWNGWGDFLASGTIANFNKEFSSFESARQFARSLKLKSFTEWRKYCKSGKKPDDIPSSPNITYKKDWKGVKDWIGTHR
ncbi:MAG: integrase repeat-containing protein [Candidatus Nitrosopumilus sp. bin_6a]